MNFKSAVLFAAVTLITCVSQLLAQDAFRFERKINDLVKPYLEHKKFQAASVGVIVGDQIWTGHFGTLSPENQVVPTDDTIYEIGSISKVFTSLLLADAVENSAGIGLDLTIGEVLPSLSKANPDVANQITLQQLSNHVSGLPRMPSNIAPENPNDPFAGYSREMLVDYLKTAKLDHEPGEKYEYSNLGAGVLGELLAMRAETNYGALLQSRIFGPLKMEESSVEVAADRSEKLAPPFNAGLIPEQSWNFDALAGAGAIRSTTTDMLKFAKANLSVPENEIGRAIELAWKEYLPAGSDHRAMGLGWMIAGDGTTRWHNGQTGGYHSMLLVNRELNAAVIMMCNTASMEADALAEAIFQTVVGMDVQPQTFADEVAVEPSVIERLVGTYQLAPRIEIKVFAKDLSLMVQLTNQQALRVIPESDTVWNYREVKAQLQFDLPETGPASKVTLLQNGRTMQAQRIGD